MDNVILFPGWIRVSDGLWHGGKKYRHIGIVKETIPVKDWRRLYLWDCVRWARGHRAITERVHAEGTA